MTILLWALCIPLTAWMLVAGTLSFAGHKSVIGTFERIGYSPTKRRLSGLAELLCGAGVLVGALYIGHSIAVVGPVAGNLITGLTWFVIGSMWANRNEKIGGWVITFLATGYLVVLMLI